MNSSKKKEDIIVSSIKDSKSDTILKNKDSKCKRKMNFITKITLYGLGTLFLCSGLIITGFWRQLYNHVLTTRLILSKSDNSESYTMWSSDTVPTYFRIYMFNWTNSESSLLNNEKPLLEEIGPYVFRIHLLKDKIIWNENNTVSFRSRRRWDFVPELSNGSLYDSITNINPVVVSIASMCKYCSEIKKMSLNALLKYNEKSIFITKTVGELLFDGYHDKMLDMLQKLKKILKNFDFPEKFAWYYEKNLTESNYYNMYTGNFNINKMGMLHSWNFDNKCHAYSGVCAQVDGSLGDLWPMRIGQQTEAPLFISDFCSNFRLFKIGSNLIYDVEGIQFEGTEDTFDNGTKRQDMRCYCPQNQCSIKSGIRNVSSCLKAPIFVSFPHFLNADSSYSDAIEGMNPNSTKHKFHITFQKDWGLVLDVTARLQINMLIEPIEGMDIFFKIPTVYLPIFWFEEYIEMPKNVQDQLKLIFNTIPNFLNFGGFIFVIIGSIFLVSGLIISRMNNESIPYSIRL